MSQILHIFRKDARHHWPLILVSALLLLGYIWTDPRQWTAAFLNVGDLPGNILIGLVRFLLPVSWLLLVVRIVHDEPLVGHRQFWVTRPYDWRKLLASKLLFAILVVNLPVFFAQMLLLKLAGFQIVTNIQGLLRMQVGLLSLLIGAILVAALTRTLTQAILLMISCIIALAAVSPLLSLIPNFAVSYVNRIGDTFSQWLVVLATVTVILWQYARRRFWQSVGVLLGVAAIILLIDVASPYATLMAKAYPLADTQHPAPAQFSLSSPTPPKSQPSPADLGSDVTLLIPVRVSGVAPQNALILNAARLLIANSDGDHWDSHWKTQWGTLWPGDNSVGVSMVVKKSDFEKLKAKPATLTLSVAMTVYSESDSREIVVRDGSFVIPHVGVCRLLNHEAMPIVCRAPANFPSYMASFSAVQSTCASSQTTDSSLSDLMGKTLIRGNHPIAGLVSPVAIFVIGFQEVPPPSPTFRGESRLHICPGTPIRFAVPIATGTSRVTLQTPNAKLADYLQQDQSISGGFGISFAP
jgi:hypothetical protein